MPIPVIEFSSRSLSSVIQQNVKIPMSITRDGSQWLYTGMYCHQTLKVATNPLVPKRTLKYVFCFDFVALQHC